MLGVVSFLAFLGAMTGVAIALFYGLKSVKLI